MYSVPQKPVSALNPALLRDHRANQGLLLPVTAHRHHGSRLLWLEGPPEFPGVLRKLCGGACCCLGADRTAWCCPTASRVAPPTCLQADGGVMVLFARHLLSRACCPCGPPHAPFGSMHAQLDAGRVPSALLTAASPHRASVTTSAQRQSCLRQWVGPLWWPSAQVSFLYWTSLAGKGVGREPPPVFEHNQTPPECVPGRVSSVSRAGAGGYVSPASCCCTPPLTFYCCCCCCCSLHAVHLGRPVAGLSFHRCVGHIRGLQHCWACRQGRPHCLRHCQ